MPKLRLKRTPAEEAERAWRKTQRAARKAARHAEQQTRRTYEDEDSFGESGDDGSTVSGSRGKKRKSSTREQPSGNKTRVDDWPDSDNEQYGPQPSSSSSRLRNSTAQPHYEDYRRHVTSATFEAKLADALAEDTAYDPTARLDGVESHLNSYVHIPRRWRGVGGDAFGPWGDDAMDDAAIYGGRGPPTLEPWQMNDDEYAEWVRTEMWKKKNPEKVAAHLHAREESRARAARAKALQLETDRLAKELTREKEERRARRRRRKERDARERYDRMWNLFVDGVEGKSGKGKAREDNNTQDKDGGLPFEDIPWPIYIPDKRAIGADDITRDSIAAFLLSSPPPSSDPPGGSRDSKPPDEPTPPPTHREILRAALLRYHPDKFNARVVPLLRPDDREKAMEVCGVVVRVLNAMLKDAVSGVGSGADAEKS